MKKVVIIDDEPLARRIVREYLKNHDDLEIVAECGDGFEGLKVIQDLEPDLIFLDIQMPKISGFEMLELIPKPPFVIFTTAFDEYAIKAFEISAVDYLLKPFDQNRFDASLNKFKINNSNASSIKEVLELPQKHDLLLNRIVVKDNNEIKIIPLLDISHIEAYDDYVKIHVKSKYHLKNQTLTFLENALKNEQFVRIHRSFLINLQYLTRIESLEKNSYYAVLTSGERIPISRSSYPKLKTLLGL